MLNKYIANDQLVVMVRSPVEMAGSMVHGGIGTAGGVLMNKFARSKSRPEQT